MVQFIIGLTLGWPPFAPPGVPPGRVAVLRKAFTRLVDDPEFQQAAESVLQVELNPIPGAELAGYVGRALSAPSGLVGEPIDTMGREPQALMRPSTMASKRLSGDSKSQPTIHS